MMLKASPWTWAKSATDIIFSRSTNAAVSRIRLWLQLKFVFNSHSNDSQTAVEWESNGIKSKSTRSSCSHRPRISCRGTLEATVTAGKCRNSHAPSPVDVPPTWRRELHGQYGGGGTLGSTPFDFMYDTNWSGISVSTSLASIAWLCVRSLPCLMKSRNGTNCTVQTQHQRFMTRVARDFLHVYCMLPKTPPRQPPFLRCTLASCGTVYCNRSCMWVCDSGRCPKQPARMQCLRLSEHFFHYFLNNSVKNRQIEIFFVYDILEKLNTGKL